MVGGMERRLHIRKAGNEFKRRRTMKTKNELESAEIKNTNDTVRAEWEGLSEADWERITCGFAYDIFSRFTRSKDAR
jgi:hypothetical protein